MRKIRLFLGWGLAIGIFVLLLMFCQNIYALQITNQTDHKVSAEIQYTNDKGAIKKKKISIAPFQTSVCNPGNSGADVVVIRLKDPRAGQLLELNNVDLGAMVTYNGESLRANRED